MSRTTVLGLAFAGVLGYAAFGVEDWNFGETVYAVKSVVEDSLPTGPSYDKPATGQPYPELCLQDSTGHEVRLRDFEGKLILIEPIGMT